MRFKVWDIKKAEWAKGRYVIDQESELLRVGGVGLLLRTEPAALVTVYSTGRADMDGAELFVGDVVECKIKRKSNFQFWTKTGGEYKAPRVIVNYDAAHSVFVVPQDLECWRVLGNLYESPELAVV